jgi:hypothetical protein
MSVVADSFDNDVPARKGKERHNAQLYVSRWLIIGMDVELE